MRCLLVELCNVRLLLFRGQNLCHRIRLASQYGFVRKQTARTRVKWDGRSQVAGHLRRSVLPVTLDRVDRRAHPRMVRWQEADQRDQQQAAITNHPCTIPLDGDIMLR